MKLPCHLLLAKLAAAAPGQLLANLHRLTEPLEKTLQTKVKTDAVKQEVCSHHAPCQQLQPQSPACLLQLLPGRCRLSCPEKVVYNVCQGMAACMAKLMLSPAIS